MGFSKNADQLLENFAINSDPSTKIKIYDEFIERQMASTTSPETHVFLMPIWRLRSSFQDAIQPIQNNAVNSFLGSKKMSLATRAIREGRIEDPNVDFILRETEKCCTIYSNYIRRLKELYNKTKYIFNTISYHKVDVLDDYAELHNYSPIATRNHYNRIVYVLEMSIVMGESIRDALENAYKVMNCAQQNLEMMLTCYQNIYTLKQLEPRYSNTNANAKIEMNSFKSESSFPWLVNNDNEGEEEKNTIGTIEIERKPEPVPDSENNANVFYIQTSSTSSTNTNSNNNVPLEKSENRNYNRHQSSQNIHNSNSNSKTQTNHTKITLESKYESLNEHEPKLVLFSHSES